MASTLYDSEKEGIKEGLLDDQQNQSSIRIYSARWAALAMFAAMSLTTSTMWVTFAPISDDTSIYFNDIGNTAVNMLAVIYQICYPPGTYLCVICMKKYGLRENLLLGAMITFIGSVLRVIGATFRNSMSSAACYSLFLLGQAFGA